MNDMSKVEAMKAAQEARDRAPSPRGSSSSAIESAMRRYLSAERYHELTEEAKATEGKAGRDEESD
jgi:hypothetical protein